MPTERDPDTLSALERRLEHPDPRVRMDAVTLLASVACPQREKWLEDRMCDEEAIVRRAAERLAHELKNADELDTELMESDLAEGMRDSDLEWAWEYLIRIYRGTHAIANAVVWTRDEDDALARRLAILKAPGAGPSSSDDLETYILSRSLVSKYTRSARSSGESMRWQSDGRPPYTE